jgi:hypothetical protein
MWFFVRGTCTKHVTFGRISREKQYIELYIQKNGDRTTAMHRRRMFDAFACFQNLKIKKKLSILRSE